jgi:hypothetical protein
MDIFSSKMDGRETEFLLRALTWIDSPHKVCGVILPRAVSFLPVYDHNEP